MRFYHGMKTLAWRAFNQSFKRGIKLSHETDVFEQKGFHLGQIDPAFASFLGNLVTNAQTIPLTRQSYVPGFAFNELDSPTIAKQNKLSKRKCFNAREAWYLAELLEMLKDDVARCLGSPWTAIKMDSWVTEPHLGGFGMYGWHWDGFVSEVFKIMVYLVPLTPENGGLEFRVDGEEIKYQSAQPGAWALFKNSDVLHRGIPGSLNKRVAVEITLARSGAFDLVPRFPGENANWPEFPWHGAIDGCYENAEIMLASCPERRAML